MTRDQMSGLSSSDNKHSSQSHSSSKLTSRHEPRKDSRGTKRSGGLGGSLNRSSERGSKEPRLLTPSYIYHDKSRPATTEETKPEAPKDTSKRDCTPNRQSSKRYHELSPLMTKMVEDELKNVMISVWKSLPDAAPTDAEVLVLDKLKGDAGDDLRNTIGMNVTNRLINIHNGILVKIIIYSPVTPADVYTFSKKYNISELKNVQARTYAGRMPSWTDLDTLYTKKDLRCGNSRVSITPIYNFMKCPPSVKTVFDGNQSYSQAKAYEKEIARKLRKLENTTITADSRTSENNHAKNRASDSKVTTEKVPESKSSDDRASHYKGSKENVSNQKDKVDIKSSKDTDAKSSKDRVTEMKSSKDVLFASKSPKVSDVKSSNSRVPECKCPKDIVTSTRSSKVPDIKKIESQTEPRKPESAGKTEITKNVVAAKPVEKPSAKQFEPVIAKKDDKPNNAKVEAKVTPKIAVKPVNDNSKVTEKQQARVESAKTVTNKPEPTNPKVAVNTPKVVGTTKAATAPAKAATTPAKVATTPAKVATTSAKVASTPAKVTTAPAKVATTPAKVTTAPAKVATTPAKVATTPVKVPTTSAKVATTPKVATAPAKVATAPAKVVTTSAKVTTTPKVITPPKKTTETPRSNEKKTEVQTPRVETNKTTVVAKPAAKKPVTISSDRKAAAPKSIDVKKPEVRAAKVEHKAKERTIVVTNNPKSIPKQEIKSKQTEVKKHDVKLTKLLPKTAKESSKSAKSYKADTKSRKCENDFDELDDHDILAMLSEGIVLDECSGSDED